MLQYHCRKNVWIKVKLIIVKLTKSTLLRLSNALLISFSATLKVRTSWFWWWPSLKHVLHSEVMSLEQKYSSRCWWIAHLFIPRSFTGSTTECVLNDSFSWCLWRCLEHSDTSHFRQVFTASDCSSIQWSQKSSTFSGLASVCQSRCGVTAR